MQTNPQTPFSTEPVLGCVFFSAYAGAKKWERKEFTLGKQMYKRVRYRKL